MSTNLITLPYKGALLSYYMEVNKERSQFIFTPALSNQLIPSPDEPYPVFTVFYDQEAFSCVGTKDKQLIAGAIEEVRKYLANDISWPLP